MSTAVEILSKLDKATMLSHRHMHKNGPKSFKRGQGALLAALSANDGATQRNLCGLMHVNRKVLKDVVRKAERNGFVTIEESDQAKTYSVKLTEEGKKVAAKHEAAEAKAAEAIVGALSAEEVEQLDVLCDKIIVAAKENGAHGKKRNSKRHCRKGHRC